jgi:DNA-binding CsgD family transcriptional regulator
MDVNISMFEVDGEAHVVVGYALKRPRAFAKLTAAELDVVEAVIEGLSTRELSRRRGVSERTVQNQLARVYAKLRVASKHELLALVGGARAEAGD